MALRRRFWSSTNKRVRCLRAFILTFPSAEQEQAYYTERAVDVFVPGWFTGGGVDRAAILFDGPSPEQKRPSPAEEMGVDSLPGAAEKPSGIVRFLSSAARLSTLQTLPWTYGSAPPDCPGFALVGEEIATQFPFVIRGQKVLRVKGKSGFCWKDYCYLF
jgi:hypothetical protein